MKDNLVYLRHILGAIEKIESYVKDTPFKIFSKNTMIVDAVVRELEIIGEAANNLGNDFQKEYPQIPFRNMIEMRNFLSHEYFGVDEKVVWDTIKEDLPNLKNIIGKLLEK